MLKLSGYNPQKTLSHFDFSVNSSVSPPFISDLSSCAFIPRYENILFCGPTAVGKTHLANAVGIEALKHGYRVLSITAFRLLSDLHVSRASGSYRRILSIFFTL